MRVDVHAHYLPDEFLEVVERYIDKDMARMVKGRAPGAGLSPKEIIAQQDQAGIDLQVMSPCPLFPFVDDEADAVAAARETNIIHAALADAHPDRFAAFGVIPLPHIDAALAELAHCLDELNMVGIALGCSIAGRQLDDPSLEPVWAELSRRETTIFLHPVGTRDPAMKAYNLNWMVGPAFENTLAALRLVLSGVTTRHPGIKVIIAQLGGTIPFLMERIDGGSQVFEESPDVELPLSKHLKRFYYDTSSRHEPALRCAVDTLGPQALVLGSDFPYSVDTRLRENVSYVEEADFPADVIASMLGANAQTLLNL